MSSVTRKTKILRKYIHPGACAQNMDENALKLIEVSPKHMTDGIMRMLSEEPFWCDLLRNLDKGPNPGMDTTGVWISKDLRLNWGWHPLFFGPYLNIASNFPMFEGIVIHEMSHIAMGHLTTRNSEMKGATPLMLHLINIAMDLAINCTAVVGGTKGKARMYDFGFYPGRALNPLNPRYLETLPPDTVEKTLQQHAEMSALIASLPEGLSYEMYLDLLLAAPFIKEKLQKEQEDKEKRLQRIREKIKQMKEKDEQGENSDGDCDGEADGSSGDDGANPSENGEGGNCSGPKGEGTKKGKGKKKGNEPGDGSGDDVSSGGEGEGESSDESGMGEPDGENQSGSELDDLMEGMGHGGHDWSDGLTEEEKQYIEEKIRDAVRRAYNRANNSNLWGSVPASIREAIKANLEGEVRWQDLLKRFVGNTNRADRVTTITRLNKKYPGIHPGTTRDYKPRINIYMDQSGSVGDNWIIKFFAELSSLARHVDFTLYYFDTEVDEENAIKWKKGTVPNMLRTRCGGTDFDAPTRHANNSECDGYIILTDGGAPKPENGKKRRAWILAPGTELYFKDVSPRDAVIKMTGVRNTQNKAA